MYKCEKCIQWNGNFLDGFNSILDTTVESTSVLGKRSGEIIQVASERSSMLKYERVVQKQKR